MRNRLLDYLFEPQIIPPELENSFRQVFDAYRSNLVEAATRSEGRAEHWNKDDPTMVGCSILTVGKDFDLSQLSLHSGANSKPEPGMLAYPLRKCAEMQALEGALNIEQNAKVDKNEKSDEPVEQGDLGVVVAVVTVSKKRNTGEEDTKDYHVLDTCKQCMTDYDLLMKAGRVSEKTIIYNVRLAEDGPLVGEPVPLGPLLKKFKENQPVRVENSIKDLLLVRDDMVRAFLQEVGSTEKQLYKELEKKLLELKGQIKIEAQKGQKKDFELLDRQEKITLEFQREVTESLLSKAEILVDEYVKRIMSAMLSAFEEGASKKLIISRLGFGHVKLNEAKEGFGAEDQKLIREELGKYLLSALANGRGK